MDFATLWELRVEEFEDAAAGFRVLGAMADTGQAAVATEAVGALRRGVCGHAGDAAEAELGALAENFRYAQVECHLAAVALAGLAADLGVLRRRLGAVVEEAEDQGMRVRQDGSVAYPSVRVGEREAAGGVVRARSDATAIGVSQQAASVDPNPGHGRALEVARRVAALVAQASEVDERWARRLRALEADDELCVSAADWADTRRDTGVVRAGAKRYLDSMPAMPTQAGPGAVAAWWRGLSAVERADVVAMYPAEVGALDGVPAAVRDEANRVVLAQCRGGVEEELARMAAREPLPIEGTGLTAHVSPQRLRFEERRRVLRERLGALRRFEERLADADADASDRRPYLLRVDPEGDGRAVVALGDPDLARHTAVHVPGTGTDLGVMPGQLDRVERLHKAASSNAKHGESVSTIAWLGYDAPELSASVLTQGRAQEAAPELQRFTEGLRETHQGERGHLTVLGHSYGSTAVGAAASKGPGLGADDIVVVGSPGMTVEKAEELQMDPDHVWAGASKNDPVVSGAADLTLGRNPAKENFGAQPIDVKDGGHSSYWDEGSVSLENQGMVIGGRKPKLREYYRDRSVGTGADGTGFHIE